jgi:hypothetical protein
LQSQKVASAEQLFIESPLWFRGFLSAGGSDSTLL